MSTPIYANTVADLGFDPATVSPVQPRIEREVLHAAWAADAWDRVAAAGLTPKKRRTRKAAS